MRRHSCWYKLHPLLVLSIWQKLQKCKSYKSSSNTKNWLVRSLLWINDLQDKEILRGIQRSYHELKYTFAVPYYYLRMTKWYPRVFVSHAMKDNESPLYLELLDSLKVVGTEVSVCEDNQSKAAVSKIGFPKWMKNEVESESNSFVIVFYLTDAFHSSVAAQDGGCWVELNEINKKLEVKPSYLEKLIFIRSDVNFSKWTKRFQIRPCVTWNSQKIFL